jgi:hypothetical protein
MRKRRFAVGLGVCFLTGWVYSGCAHFFGWDIHAPGVLSNNYFTVVAPASGRVALELPEDLEAYRSEDKGGKLADPQIYHVGEAFRPMIIEAFQHSFDEFVLMVAEPTPEIMARYDIPYLVRVRISGFRNDVNLKGQQVALVTETLVFNRRLELVDRFESTGSSAAQKVFAKKGGPEVNLNAAIENNIRAVVQHLQDRFYSAHAKSAVGP